MSKFRKKLITVLAVLFCALLALSTALLIPKNESAEAYATPQTATVDELYSGGTNGFSAKHLRTLYGKLVSNATKLDDINIALNNSNSSTLSVADFAASDTVVKFGNMEWTAVYISRAQHNLGGISPDNSKAGYAGKDDIILTLWLANPIDVEQWNYWQNNGDPPDNYNNDYLANLYGTSSMRSVTLGNGGAYWESGNSLSTPSGTIIKQSKFALYATGDLKDYLVAPRYIGWQYQQSAIVSSGYSNNFNNDAWGRMINGFSTNYQYENKYTSGTDYYSVWKDDLVWLPSLAEVGGNNDLKPGLWKTTSAQRICNNSTWLRSAKSTNTRSIYHLINNGTSDYNYINLNLLVRPAIHLNLTKAAAAAKGVSYDAVTPTKVEETSEINKSETDHTFEHVYDGNDVIVKLAEEARLDVVGPYVGNNEPQSEATYSSGEFIANKPKKDGDETYIIKVTPKTDPADGKSYVWDDNDGTKERYYKIKIKRADINASWSGLNRAVGEDVLQNLQQKPITSATNVSGVKFDEKYKIVTNSSDYLSADSKTWDTTTNDWKPRAVGSSDFAITQAVTYRVYYEITADYHNEKRGFYDVTVSTDSVKYVAKSTAAVRTVEYASNGATNLTLQTTLNGLFSDNVTMSNNDGELGSDAVSDLMKKVDVKLFKLVNGNRQNVDFPTDGRLPAGDYYMYIDWNVNPQDRTVVLNETASTFPKFTIDPKSITVEIVAEDGGDLKHVYGDDEVKLKYKVTPGDLVGNDTEADLKLGDIFIVGTNNTQISSATAVGTYDLTGKQTGTSNYKVTFDDCKYEVTKRPVTLKAADEEVEFGTSFKDYKYKTPTLVSGNFVNGDKLSAVITGTEYSLKLNGFPIDFSNSLPVGVYELYAVIEADNYVFTVESGKLTVTKGNFDMSGVKLENKGYIYNGEARAAQISGTLPSSEISVSYRYVNMADGSESTEPPTEIGLYLVYASFTHSNDNYNEIGDKVAYIRIAATAEEANQAFPALPTDEEIANAANVAKKKQEAKKTLDEEAKKKKDEIDAKEELTDEEKEAAKKKVDEELAKGNAAIDGATDINGVNQAYNDGKANIEKIKAEHKEESSFPWWIIAVIAGVLVVLAVIIIIVVKRRNSEDEEEDFYDDEYDFDDEEVEEEDYGDDF